MNIKSAPSKYFKNAFMLSYNFVNYEEEIYKVNDSDMSKISK